MNYDPAMREKILSFIRENGPVLPVQISKQFGGNLLFSGAILSELASRKAIKISNAKIGGSPVYYVNGQERKLDLLYLHLRDVHKKIFDTLKEEKVLRDSELEPCQRVALRELKDFAHMIEKEDGIYWRWYLTNDGEALNLIKERFKIETKVEVPRIESKAQPGEEINQQGEVKFQQEILREEPKVEERPVEVKEKKTRAKRDIGVGITNYFSGKRTRVIEENIIRKNSEMNYIVEIPSNIGDVKFFVKVRNKKNISEGDVVLAHNEAQLRKLPLLFLSSGELNKKARDYITGNSIKFEKL